MPIAASTAGEAHSRGFFLIGNAPHLDAITMACSAELRAVSRVQVVDASVPSPYEYVFLLAVGESDSAVAISVNVTERLEYGLASRFYIKGDDGKFEDAGGIANLMTPIGQLEIQVGPPESIGQMCRTIVHLIDVRTFTKERENPRGGAFDNMYASFLTRMGAKRVK